MHPNNSYFCFNSYIFNSQLLEDNMTLLKTLQYTKPMPSKICLKSSFLWAQL